MNSQLLHRYEDGPTACMASNKVLKSIHKQIKAAKALSVADIRLASRMGLLSADVNRPLGFNDGIVFPADSVPAAAPALSPTRAAARAAPSGKLHALALMVDFSDNKGTRPAAEFQSLLFDPANPSSMTSYYKKLSYGALEVTGEVLGYVRAPQPYTYYTAGESGTGELTYPRNTPGLLVDALTEFCKTDSLKRFDVDGDGFVDGLFLIHAGGGAETEPDPAKRPDMIWSHKWVLPTPFENAGVKVFAYSTEPEDGKLGVFCHEFGHVLGLPDLYDTSYRSSGAGDWCLMAGGSYGGGGGRPVRMCCWCLSRLGWATPTVVKKAAALTLTSLEQGPTGSYRVWTGGKPGPEYFLLENRQTTGQDAELPGSGLAVWHIDERQSGNTNPFAYLVGLVQADGLRQLELGTSQGDAGDLFPGTKKVTKASDATNPSLRSNDGAASKVALSAIKVTDGVVKVNVKV